MTNHRIVADAIRSSDIDRPTLIIAKPSLALAFSYCSVFLFSVLPLRSMADDSWDRFRGPNGSGVLQDCKVQIPWSDSQVSRISLEGTGNGSPVLFRDRAFVLSSDPQTAQRFVYGIDLKTNSIEWRKAYESIEHSLHQFSSYASSTPCVDDQGVYVAWADPKNVVVKAFSHDGSERWSRDFGRYVSQHGFGTSPILVDGLLILLNSQDAQELPPGVEPGQDSMIALEITTGQVAWQVELPTKRVCYGVPCVRKTADATELICSTTGQGMFALNAKSGELLWSHDCFRQRVCSSAVLSGNILLGTHGSGGGRDNLLVAFDVDQRKELFRINRFAPYVPTPVVDNGFVFLWSDTGIVTCIELKSGSQVWNKRIGGDYSGSPVILGDKLINASHDGKVTVLAATGEFEELGSIETSQTIRSTLAARSDCVLLRSNEELWIIR